MARLVILTGPSCVGKGPLCNALRRFHPELLEGMERVVLYNSRTPRPGEVDGVHYHFRTREQIQRFVGTEGFLVMDVRGDLQALQVNRLRAMLEKGDVFFEGNVFIARELMEVSLPEGAERIGIFLSPLSLGEIREMRRIENLSLPDFVTDVMRRKLLRRTVRLKAHISLPDLQEIERRAGTAWSEVRLAHRFDWVLPNHDGEDSENWDAFYYPLGDARLALQAFAALLRGETSDRLEKWPPDLLS